MAKKWTNEKVDEQLSQRELIRITDLTTISSPSTTKLEWKCNKCDELWRATLDSVINIKSGCPQCAGNKKFTIGNCQKILTAENRNIKVLELYDGHRNQERKGKFRCNICDNTWTAILSNVMHKKQGCPKCGKCGRYNKDTINQIKDIPGKLYLIECKNDAEHFIKIGITKRNVKNRYTNVDFSYNILDNIEFTMSMLTAWTIEQHILKNYTCGRYLPQIKFGGRNECYLPSEKQRILFIIQELINV